MKIIVRPPLIANRRYATIRLLRQLWARQTTLTTSFSRLITWSLKRSFARPRDEKFSHRPSFALLLPERPLSDGGSNE